MGKKTINSVILFSSIILIAMIFSANTESQGSGKNILPENLSVYSPIPIWSGAGAVCRGFSGLGDVNGDGYDDCYAANGGTSYVYLGKPDIRKLNLKLLIQGFYDSLANINTPDTLRLYLRKSVFPYSIIDSSKTILNSGGEAEFKLLHTAKNLDFYIVTKHRNTIETWSSVPVRFIDSLMAYNFSDSKANAYVNNQTKVKISPLRYALFSGDVNQDGIIDSSDMAEVDNAAFNGLSGYVKSDLTGDNFVDAQDLSLVDNNSCNAVIVIRL